MKKKLIMLLLLFGILATARSQNITAAEYFIDTDPGVGNGTSINIGTPGDIVNFTAVISTVSLSAGFHFVAIRAKDANGSWSHYDKRGFYLSTATTDAGDIVAAEYFLDADPGQGNGTFLPVGTPGTIVNFAAAIPASLSAGFHFLTIRLKDSDGKWSLFEKRGFYLSTATTDAGNIVAAEYFFDADPGQGNGTSLTVGTPGPIVNFSVAIPTSLASGFHFLAIRTKDADGKWGHFDKRGFYISTATIDAADITAAEYFFDTDPGVGNGTSVSVGTSGATVNFTAVIPTSLTEGFHFVAIRTRDADGKWGLFEKRGFYVSNATTNSPIITAAEYFIDADPGVGNGTLLTVTAPGDVVAETFNITPVLPLGSYNLAIRVKGQDGKWGLFDYKAFTIGNSTINCPANVSVNTGVGECSAVVNNINPTINPPQSNNYTLTGATTGTGSGSASGLSFNAGVTTVTYALTNSPTISCSFTVTVTAVAPNITTQPTTQSICVGDNVTFTVAATGSGLTYQWRKGGVNISGATSSSYTINNAIAGDAGNYDVVVSSPCGLSATSATAVLSVGSVLINTQPVSQAVCPATSVTFTVVVTGTGLTYQWRKGGMNIAGATSPSYTINNVAAGDAGDYDVVITSTCGNTFSSIATLTVNSLTSISVQPIGQALCVGSNATFSVIAAGTGLTYQWRKGGVNIGGATSSSYTINGITTGDAGNYDVVVSGTCPPSVTSSTATLIVNTPPAISVQPVSQAICAGNNVTFSVTANGTGLTYQWRKGGVNISGATSSSYTINGITSGDAGSYDVVVNGTCPPSATSSAAILTVNTAPSISIHPLSQTICAGDNVTFSVTASGTALTYQWRKSGVNISGATSSTYTINGLVAGDAGNYDVVVSGTCPPAATSSVAILTVNPITAITVQPANQSSCVGGSVTFSVTSAGTSLSYQWKKDGTDISGATSSSYTIDPVGAGDAAAYTVVVTGACGAQTSSSATLTIAAGTIINIQPIAQSSCLGASVTFTVSGSGSGTLTYQWKKNGVDISGATSSSYTINPVNAGDAADYSVVVTSGCGSTTSNSVALTIIPSTVITVQPVSQTICLDGSVTFTVTATGNDLSYQWRKGGVNITGANSTSYTIVGINAGDVANYDVVVTGTCGTVTSNATSLSLADIVIITQPVSQTVCAGGNVTFSVIASGIITGYQWRKNAVNISGATSASYTMTGVTAGDEGSYDVLINGICEDVLSNGATLTVNGLPAITIQPLSQAVCLGTDVTFSITAIGTNLSYQWRKGGVNISGATLSSYTIIGVVAGDAGNYDVVVSGTCPPTATSNVAVLSITPSPTISVQPVSQTVFVGSNVTFSVTATGAGLTYQWRKGGVNIPGATSSSYTITSVVVGDAGNYDVVITGTCSPSVTSNIAVLVVNTITITTQPVNQSVCVGTNATFSIVVAGSNPTYQWQVSTSGGPFNNIAGAANVSLTLSAVTISMNGNQYRCVVSGSLNSNAATLTVNPLPVVTLNLSFDTLYLNSPVQVLSGGSPTGTGGVYSGTGISGGSFLPGAFPLGNYTITYRFTDANGCSASATDVFTIIPKADNVTILPNPSPNGNLTFIASQSMVGSKASVYDAMGRKVFEWTIASRSSTYRFKWAAGTYTFIFTNGDVQIVKRVAVMR